MLVTSQCLLIYVTRLLNILNVGSPEIGGRLNDPDRAVAKNPDDPRLQFIL